MTDNNGTVRHGTQNIFADLGYADAESHLLKASLVSRIHDIVLERKLSARVKRAVSSVERR